MIRTPLFRILFLPARPSPAAAALLLGAGLALFGCGGEPPGGESAGSRPNPLLQPRSFAETAPEDFQVHFETTQGEILIRIHRGWAPRGADRFYNLVKAGYYDGVTFHRVVEGFVAEFGIHPDPWVNAAWRQAILQDDPVMTSNTRGRVTFSKSGPNSRTVQVFINTDDNPNLDARGFSPFGDVVEGMEVVDALYAGYGEGPPRGDGVYQAMAIAKGEEYLSTEFPLLDRIVKAEVAEGG